MSCSICRTRRPRRFCPGVGGDICAPCCGSEREVTVSCPLDCEYLREARKHDKPAITDPAQIPHSEIEITENFLERNDRFLITLGRTLVDAGLRAGAVDFDAREALEGLVQTYLTLRSGVYYESRPANPLAATVYDAVQKAVAEYRENERRLDGVSQTRDADVLGTLAYLQRMELATNNGRRRGRAFLDIWRSVYGATGAPAPEAPASSLILP